MATKPLPSQEVLRQLLDYDPDTGALTWRNRSIEWFEPSATRTAEHICNLWNARYANKPAFTSANSDGYLTGHILGGSEKAHRIIWKWMTGDAADQVDHIDGNRCNNRWENLREVSAAGNTRNQKRRQDNTTGLTGIYWYTHERKHGKWLVKIAGQHIGIYDCIGQAIKARQEAERQHGFHENHGRAA